MRTCSWCKKAIRRGDTWFTDSHRDYHITGGYQHGLRSRDNNCYAAYVEAGVPVRPEPPTELGLRVGR